MALDDVLMRINIAQLPNHLPPAAIDLHQQDYIGLLLPEPRGHIEMMLIASADVVGNQLPRLAFVCRLISRKVNGHDKRKVRDRAGGGNDPEPAILGE